MPSHIDLIIYTIYTNYQIQITKWAKWWEQMLVANNQTQSTLTWFECNHSWASIDPWAPISIIATKTDQLISTANRFLAKSVQPCFNARMMRAAKNHSQCPLKVAWIRNHNPFITASNRNRIPWKVARFSLLSKMEKSRKTKWRRVRINSRFLNGQLVKRHYLSYLS